MESINNTFLLSASDLANHLSCAHLTQLHRKVAEGTLKRPHYNDPSLAVLEQRGRDHEAGYVHSLSETLKVIDLKNQPFAATIKAMSDGVDVIVQARLEDKQWMGYADILLKVPGKSRFGDWAYEVQDTKLAQNTRATAILQLCLYTDLLTILQGNVPEKMYVVKPGDNFPTEEYRFAEFQAYYRLVKKNLQKRVEGDVQITYPEPVEHCSICRWWSVCDKQRHDDDHLSLVAGIRTLHIEELVSQKITTLEQLANTERIERPKRGNKETFIKKQSQAKVQLKGRVEKRMLYEQLPIEAGRGLNRLPESSGGDIYFDIEGDAFYPDGGLEYLLGFAYKDQNGQLIYQKIWLPIETRRNMHSSHLCSL